MITPTTELIAGAPVIDDPMTGRRRILMRGGGYFTSNGDAWWYHPGIGRPPVLVTVPSTIAALEARDAELRRAVTA